MPDSFELIMTSEARIRPGALLMAKTQNIQSEEPDATYGHIESSVLNLGKQ